jgi:hypothetical protein
MDDDQIERAFGVTGPDLPLSRVANDVAAAFGVPVLTTDSPAQRLERLQEEIRRHLRAETTTDDGEVLSFDDLARMRP